jgi:hypothetical protein
MGREMGRTMGREELNGFLAQRPVAGQGSASSQNQDLSALVCLLLEPLVRDRQHVRPSSSGIWRQGGGAVSLLHALAATDQSAERSWGWPSVFPLDTVVRTLSGEAGLSPPGSKPDPPGAVKPIIERPDSANWQFARGSAIRWRCGKSLNWISEPFPNRLCIRTPTL